MMDCAAICLRLIYDLSGQQVIKLANDQIFKNPSLLDLSTLWCPATHQHTHAPLDSQDERRRERKREKERENLTVAGGPAAVDV